MSTKRPLVNFDQRTRRLNVPVIIGVVMLCLMGAMVLHGWSQSNSFVPAIQVLLGTAEGGVAGEVITQGDITLYIPPNATEQQGRFSIAEANPDVTLISNDTQWIRPKVVNVEFVQPNGLALSNISFSEPVEICFSLSNEQWQAFLDQPDAFEVHHYVDNADEPYWEVLPQVSYAERQQLCGQTEELSAFALAIRVEAQVPVTGATATATDAFSPLAPTRTRIGPTQTRNPERGGAAAGSVVGDGPGAPTVTPRPLNTLRPADTATLQPTNTLRPPNTATIGPTNTPRPTNTRRPTRPPTFTSVPATNTPRPPSATPTEPPATNTPRPPTATDLPDTNTPRPPTATDPPPTNTPVPPTDIPPTDPPPTDPPPTDPPPTDPPPPDTPEPEPTATEDPGGGF